MHCYAVEVVPSEAEWIAYAYPRRHTGRDAPAAKQGSVFPSGVRPTPADVSS